MNHEKILKASILPWIRGEKGGPVEEIIACDSISGGLDYMSDMPRTLSLVRTLKDGIEYRMSYVQAGVQPVVKEEPKRGSGTTTWQTFAMLASIIKEKNTQIQISREVAQRIVDIVELIELQDINITYSAGKYFASCSFGSAHEDRPGL